VTGADRVQLHPHPAVYSVLMLPFGAVGGYLTVALAFVLSHSGISATEVGLLIATYGIPQALKFLWAPIVDTSLSRKSWYLIGTTLSALCVLAMAIFSSKPTSLVALNVVVFVSSIAVCTLSMSVEFLTAYGTSDADKGRVAGWFQAGNLGGNGLGGGAALWLSQWASAPWVTGATLAMTLMLCCVALLFVADPPSAFRTHTGARRLLDVLQDVWLVARSRRGFLAMLVIFLPIGTGAASNLWAAVADDWHASAGKVALINGALSGMISIPACILGGYLCDRFDRKFSYIAFGLLQALCAVAMAIAPRTENGIRRLRNDLRVHHRAHVCWLLGRDAGRDWPRRGGD
jgi:MFS transporter, PAT family, beta-lactamase induction signal transducer AmpG